MFILKDTSGIIFPDLITTLMTKRETVRSQSPKSLWSKQTRHKLTNHCDLLRQQAPYGSEDPPDDEAGHMLIM